MPQLEDDSNDYIDDVYEAFGEPNFESDPQFGKKSTLFDRVI